MKLLTSEQRALMLENGRQNATLSAKDGDTHDFKPVVKLFTPWAGATWLLTELYPDDPDVAFGLCDLGQGCPELGSARLSEIERLRGPAGLRVERDLHFSADKTISAYAADARRRGYIFS